MSKASHSLMIIDDNELFVYLMKKVLAKTNAFDHITEFDNGQDAIEYFMEAGDDDTLLPDFVFLDLSMPLLDGWQFLDEYELRFPDRMRPRIYIISSSISPDDISRAKSMKSVENFLIKPVTYEKIMEIVLKGE